MTQEVTTIRNQLKADLKAAMKARRTDHVSVLRSLLAAIDNAEAVDVSHLPAPSLNIDACGHVPDMPRKDLTAADLRQIIASELQETRQALAEYTSLGLESEVERLTVQLTIIQNYVK